jgi:hypothetical protein
MIFRFTGYTDVGTIYKHTVKLGGLHLFEDHREPYLYCRPAMPSPSTAVGSTQDMCATMVEKRHRETCIDE